MSIGLRIKESRLAAGLTQIGLAKKSGVSQQMISKLESGKSDKTNDVFELAAAVDRDPRWLATGKGEKYINKKISPKKESYPILDGKEELSNVTKAIGYRPHEMPLISWVQAGNFCEAIDGLEKGDAEDWMLRPHNAGNNSYALKVQGDSMTSPYPGQRSYPEGTIIYVDPDACITSGKRVIARIPNTNEATFKTYVEDAGQAYLKPINPQYDKIPVTSDVLICGVVIGSYLPE